jgi:hypothetical protein
MIPLNQHLTGGDSKISVPIATNPIFYRIATFFNSLLTPVLIELRCILSNRKKVNLLRSSACLGQEEQQRCFFKWRIGCKKIR